MIMTTRYATVTEFRNITNLGSSEYSDTKIGQLLDFATEIIDARTGRTWQGSQTVTDEMYDGNGESFFYLDQVDIASVSALSIDEDYDGTFVDIDLSDILLYDEIGKLVLDVAREPSIAVEAFTKGNQTVKVSYTYGGALPTNNVKELCINIAWNELNSTPELVSRINQRLALFRANSIDVG